MKQIKTILRALRYRNYRLFFFGQSISLVGTWMQMTANGWLLYRLTHSVFLLGIMGFASQIPTFLLAPVAGVLADRANRHRIIIFTQCLSMIQAFILSVLALTNTIQPWHIIALAVCLGLVNGFDIPTRQSFLVEMIEDREDLGNAIALNSSMVNGARLLGPSIAGILVATVGEGVCFFINAISYIAVIFALLAMNIKPRKITSNNGHILYGLKEGYRYVKGFPSIKYILLFLSLVSLMGTSYGVLMPVFAKEIFKGDSRTLGFLIGAAGLGALIGAMYLAARKNTDGLIRIIIFSAAIFGIGLISFSFSRIFWVSLLLLCVTGFGMMIQMASSNTAIQTLTADDKRGRVMSFYTMAFMGMTPFGSLFAGSLASKIGAPHALLVGGISCILGTFYFSRKLSVIKEVVPPL